MRIGPILKGARGGGGGGETGPLPPWEFLTVL